MAQKKCSSYMIKDVSMIIFYITAIFGAGGVVFMVNDMRDDMKVLSANFSKLVVNLKVNKVIPENLCMDDKNTITVAQLNEKIPKPKDNRRRAACKPETAINSKEDFETNMFK